MTFAGLRIFIVGASAAGRCRIGDRFGGGHRRGAVGLLAAISARAG
ncbi:MAG: hypothetical protein R3C58_09115 [Parvularculaceae bacterium]